MSYRTYDDTSKRKRGRPRLYNSTVDWDTITGISKHPAKGHNRRGQSTKKTVRKSKVMSTVSRASSSQSDMTDVYTDTSYDHINANRTRTLCMYMIYSYYHIVYIDHVIVINCLIFSIKSTLLHFTNIIVDVLGITVTDATVLFETELGTLSDVASRTSDWPGLDDILSLDDCGTSTCDTLSPVSSTSSDDFVGGTHRGAPTVSVRRGCFDDADLGLDEWIDPARFPFTTLPMVERAGFFVPAPVPRIDNEPTFDAILRDFNSLLGDTDTFESTPVCAEFTPSLYPVVSRRLETSSPKDRFTLGPVVETPVSGL